ncbi:MAG TPA: hypothetical protein VFG89_10605 [Coriobacteriia bacterium]|nr:hypothetical protein [Coriobacteriia bacterium]
MRTQRRSLAILILIVFLVFGAAQTAFASSKWKTVKPTSQFKEFAARANSQGLSVWYPRRVPKGFKVTSETYYDDPGGYPNAVIDFSKGTRTLEFTCGTARWQGKSPTKWRGSLKWGSKRAKYLGKKVHTIGYTGPDLSGDWHSYSTLSSILSEGDKPMLSAGQMRYISKNMRRVK